MRPRLGMLASHGGTNVQSVVEACREGRLAAEPALIISNNRDSAVLVFGRSRGIPSVWIGGAAYEDQALRDQAICTQLSNHDVDVVLLLGYMRQLGPATLGCFRNRILNIHPALLPKHGGKGKYGLHVHESVLASGDTETGVSIHLGPCPQRRRLLGGAHRLTCTYTVRTPTRAITIVPKSLCIYPYASTVVGPLLGQATPATPTLSWR